MIGAVILVNDVPIFGPIYFRLVDSFGENFIMSE